MVLVGCQNKKENDGVKNKDEITEKTNDVTPPEIICNGDAVGCIIGDENDLSAYVDAKDDSDDEVTIDIDDSEVDYEKQGKYYIKITATDSSENQSSEQRACYVVNKASSSEVMSCINEIIENNYPQYGVSSSSREEIIKDKRFHSFQADDNEKGCVYWIYSNLDDYIENYNYDIGNEITETAFAEVYVTNINYGLLNLDSPWMCELTIESFLFSLYGDVIPEWDSIVFKSDRDELVLSDNNLYGYGYDDYFDNSFSSTFKTYCFSSEDEIDKFSDLLNGENVTFELRLGDDVVDTISLSEDNINHFKDAINAYKTVANSELIFNIPKEENIENIYWVNSRKGDTKEESENKVFPGEDITVSFEEEDLILMDNDNATVKIKNVYQEGGYIGLTLTVTNNRDTKFLFNLEDLYIDDLGVTSVMCDGNEGPAPGKTRSYTYYIEYQDGTSLDSLKDLCVLNGVIELNIMVEDESYICGDDRILFNLGDCSEIIEKKLNELIEY